MEVFSTKAAQTVVISRSTKPEDKRTDQPHFTSDQPLSRPCLLFHCSFLIPSPLHIPLSAFLAPATPCNTLDPQICTFTNCMLLIGLQFFDSPSISVTEQGFFQLFSPLHLFVSSVSLHAVLLFFVESSQNYTMVWVGRDL